MRNPNLIALGDSHLNALKLAADLHILDANRTDFCIVPGATAIGLRNPNSMTNAIGEFTAFLSAAPSDSRVLIHLGEVDCGFVIWWRAERRGENIELQFEQSIEAYREFVNDIIARGFEHVCITGASLPTIGDGVDMGEIANLRREVKISLLERTNLTRRYNQSLKEIAKGCGVSYFDISAAVLNRTDGVVQKAFKNIDPHDHHLDPDKTVGIWAYCCNAFLREND